MKPKDCVEKHLNFILSTEIGGFITKPNRWIFCQKLTMEGVPILYAIVFIPS